MAMLNNQMVYITMIPIIFPLFQWAAPIQPATGAGPPLHRLDRPRGRPRNFPPGKDWLKAYKNNGTNMG